MLPLYNFHYNSHDLFLIGGFTVAGIKFLSNVVGPIWAALLGAAPIGYISSYYIKDSDKIIPYLTNYIYTLISIIIGAILYIYLLHIKLDRNISLIIGLIFIAIINVIRIIIFTPLKI